jgi:hypothetical protein
MALVPNYRVAEFIGALKPFKANSMRGELWSTGDYDVYSYGAKLLTINAEGKVVYLDERRYSVTTSKHQGYVRQGIAGRDFGLGAAILTRK